MQTIVFDLDNQTPGNYTYDSIGNITGDAMAHLGNVQWNVYNKMTHIDHSPAANG